MFSRSASGGFVRASRDESTVPASYGSATESQKLVLDTKLRKTVQFRVAPLGSVQGWVYLDLNENGKRDEGEGRVGVAVHLADKVTATVLNGSFGFYNLEPGTYAVWIDPQRLGKEYEPITATKAEVVVSPGKAAPSVEFGVKTRKKEIRFQELGG